MAVLATEYLKRQRKHWPVLVTAGLLPEPTSEIINQMVEDFKHRHRTGDVRPDALAAFAVYVKQLVDYSQPFAGSDHQAWEAEYRAKVHEWASLSLLDVPSQMEVRHGEDLLVAPARREQSPAIGGADDSYLFHQEEDWHDFCFD